MAVVLAVFFYILLQVVDVSTQSCVIRPDRNELTLRNPLGRDVELHCQCRDVNGTDVETWWFSGSTVVSRSDSVRPYSTISNPSRLIITASFTNADMGMYTCANTNPLSGTLVRDMITLNARAEVVSNGDTTCTIVSTNLPSLTAAGGIILIGTENVIIYCICTRMRDSDIISVGPTIWSRDNGQLILAATDETNSNPYYRNNVPSPLIIPSFAATHADTYRCGSGSVVPVRVNATFSLTAAQSCVISPNISSLTIRNQIGRNIELHCQCVDVNGIPLTGARWLSGDTLIGARDDENPSRNPYYITDIPSRLIIATGTFGMSLAGTYTCHMSDTTSPRNTIRLINAAPSGSNRVCTIYSTKLITLTAAGGLISSGTPNVTLYCVCRIGNVAVSPTTWFDGRTATSTMTSDNPYFRNNVPSPLIFSSFGMANVGTYGCGSNNPDEPNVTMDLNLLGVIQPPTDVTVELLTPRSVCVMWTRPSGSGVTGYLISYITTASYTRGGNMMVSGLNNLRGTLSTLEEDTNYIVIVQSTSNNGLSIDSNIVNITTYTAAPSSPPRMVMVTSVNPAALRVTWQPPPQIAHNGPITGYVIQYTRVGSNDMMMSVNVDSGIEQYNISELIAYVNYTVMVAARNSNGTGNNSDPLVVRSGQNLPTAPRSLMVVGSTETSVTLSWMAPDPPNGNITQYNVLYRIRDGSRFTTVNTMATDLTYTVTELTTATEYRFRVTAFTVVGEGNRSDFVDVFVGLLAPTNVRATILTPRSVQVTWIPSSSSDVTGYLISYTTNASYISVNNRSRSMMIDNTTTGTLTDLEEGTTYTITVQATASNNIKSGNSNAETVTTQTIAPSSPPLDVMVATFDPASLMVSWQPPPPIDHNAPIIGYMIQYIKDGSSDLMSVNVTNETTYTISGLPVSTEYSVRVAAMNINGTGPFSNPMINRSGEDRPSKPESLDIIGVNSSSVMLKWRPPLTRNGVIVLYSLKYYSTTLIVTNTSCDVLMYTVGGLSSENVYIFQVTAHTRVGEGPPINIAVAIPPSPVPDVTIPNDTVTTSTLILSWMMPNLTNSVLIHYTVFYLPVSGPYGPIMASNRRKRQSAQAGELTMNFTSGTTGTLRGLNGSVTYRIQVAAVVTLNVNGQVVTGDRSAESEITTQEGLPTSPRDLKIMVTNNEVTLTWSRPDPPNGLITQYSVSYINTNTQDSNITTLPVVNGGDENLNYIQTGLSQGTYNFIVVASTAVGPGEAANMTEFITFASIATGNPGSVALPTPATVIPATVPLSSSTYGGSVPLALTSSSMMVTSTAAVTVPSSTTTPYNKRPGPRYFTESDPKVNKQDNTIDNSSQEFTHDTSNKWKSGGRGRRSRRGHRGSRGYRGGSGYRGHNGRRGGGRGGGSGTFTININL